MANIAELLHLIGQDTVMIEARLYPGDEALPATLLSVHLSNDKTSFKNQFDRVCELVCLQSHRMFVIVGDFNATPFLSEDNKLGFFDKSSSENEVQFEPISIPSRKISLSSSHIPTTKK